MVIFGQDDVHEIEDCLLGTRMDENLLRVEFPIEGSNLIAQPGISLRRGVAQSEGEKFVQCFRFESEDLPDRPALAITAAQQVLHFEFVTSEVALQTVPFDLHGSPFT